MVGNGNGKAAFAVDKITVFAVNVANSKNNNVSNSVSGGQDYLKAVSDLRFSDKSLSVLRLCAEGACAKRDLLISIGGTNQTINVRNIINPLITSGCMAPIDEDREIIKNVRYGLTSRGVELLSNYSSSMSSDEV